MRCGRTDQGGKKFLIIPWLDPGEEFAGGQHGGEKSLTVRSADIDLSLICLAMSCNGSMAILPEAGSIYKMPLMASRPHAAEQWRDVMRREGQRASAGEAPMSKDYLLFAIPFASLLVGIVFGVAIRRREGRRPWKH